MFLSPYTNRFLVSKKIFYISHHPLENQNGPTFHTLCVCEELARMGYHITLNAPAKDSVSAFQYIKKNLYHKSTIPILRAFDCELQALQSFFHQESIDYVYIRLANFHVLPFLVKKPFFLEINGNVLKEMRLANKQIKGILVSHYHKILMKKASAIISVDPKITQAITFKEIEHKIFTIHNGYNHRIFFKDVKSASDTLSPYGIFSGSVQPWYDIDFLFRVFKKTFSNKPEHYFYFIVPEGSHSILNKLIQKFELSEKVFVKTAESQEKIAPYIKGACYALHPLISDGNPLRLFEYLACGTSVIASNISKPEFDIPHLYICERDEHIWAEKILSLLQKRPLLSSSIFEVMREKYSWQATAKNISDVFQWYEANKS